MTVASQLKQLPKAEMLDLDMLLLVATMVRLAQTWALLPLPAECSWTDHQSGRLIRSRYWTFCEIRDVPTAVDRTVSSTKILGFFTREIPIIDLHGISVMHRIQMIRYMLSLMQDTLP